MLFRSDDSKIEDIGADLSLDAFEKGFVVIRKGKKVYHKVILEK